MTTTPAGRPAIGTIAVYFIKLGAIGFGGPAALAERMRSDLVEARGWLSPEDFDLGLTIAAACPGPLAYQLAVYCGFVLRGPAGAAAVGVAFAAAPFLLVVAAAAAYRTWSTSALARGLFHGAAPVVTVLIARATWNLGRKTLHRSTLAWVICSAGATITAVVGREPLWLFVVAGAAGAWRLRPAAPGTPLTPPVSSSSTGVLGALAATGMGAPTLSSGLFAFFFKTGCLVFGSGLVIVPFLRSALVDEYGWLTTQQFLDSVTVGLVSPGPVVITATFVGYLVDRLPGALAATAGMFLPAVLVTVAATPWFMRHRHHPGLGGLVRGVTAAVVGVLAGTVPIVARSAVPDAGALVILAMSLLVALRWRVADPVLVAGGAAIGAGLALATR